MTVDLTDRYLDVSQPAFEWSDFSDREGLDILRAHGVIGGVAIPNFSSLIMEIAGSAQRHGLVAHDLYLEDLFELAGTEHETPVSLFAGELARFGFTEEADFHLRVGRGVHRGPHRDGEPTVSVGVVRGAWYALRPENPEYYRGVENRADYEDFLPPGDLVEAPTETIIASDGELWHRSPQVEVDRASITTYGTPDIEMFNQATGLSVAHVA